MTDPLDTAAAALKTKSKTKTQLPPGTPPGPDASQQDRLAWLTKATTLHRRQTTRFEAVIVHGWDVRSDIDLVMANGRHVALDANRLLNPNAFQVAVGAASHIACPLFSKNDMKEIAQVVWDAARTQVDHDENAEAAGWGLSYLDLAGRILVDLTDMTARWEAWQQLRTAGHRTAQFDENDHAAIYGDSPPEAAMRTARHTAALELPDRSLLVVKAFIVRHVIRDLAERVSTQGLATRLARVGWSVPFNNRGAMTARDDGRAGASRTEYFLAVPPGWVEAQAADDPGAPNDPFTGDIDAASHGHD